MPPWTSLPSADTEEQSPSSHVLDCSHHQRAWLSNRVWSHTHLRAIPGSAILLRYDLGEATYLLRTSVSSFVK